jgi:hypothetical protein
MKTNIFLLLIVFLAINIQLALAQSIGKIQPIIKENHKELMKQMTPEEAKMFRDSIMQAFKDSLWNATQEDLQRQRQVQEVPVSETFDWGPTLEHSPFDLSPEQQDSVKKAQRKIIALYKKTPFTELDECDQEALIIAKGKLTMLTFAPCYYREGPNVAPPLIQEHVDQANNRYYQVRFSYDPNQEAYYKLFKEGDLPDEDELSYRYSYHKTLRWGPKLYLELFPGNLVTISANTGEVYDIMIGSRGYALDIGSADKSHIKKFRYNVMQIKDDKLRKQLEEQIKEQKEMSE